MPDSQPGESRQETLCLGVRSAADAQIRSVQSQRQAQRTRSGVEGKVRDQVRRDAPDPLSVKVSHCDRQIRPPQVSRRGHHPPGFVTYSATDPSPPSP